MRERILQIIEKEGISASEFADKIGVQRSNVSHVLNGRNNPGFSFIQKIIEAFPDINTRWLMIGEGTIYISDKEKSTSSHQKHLFDTQFSASTPIIENTPSLKSTTKVENEFSRATIKEIDNEQPIIKAQEPLKITEKRIKRVMFFYEDQSFEDFHPNNIL
jgi:transcriptional regulator with XRE-family HTH domain